VRDSNCRLSPPPSILFAFSAARWDPDLVCRNRRTPRIMPSMGRGSAELFIYSNISLSASSLAQRPLGRVRAQYGELVKRLSVQDLPQVLGKCQSKHRVDRLNQPARLRRRSTSEFSGGPSLIFRPGRRERSLTIRHSASNRPPAAVLFLNSSI
jgi:hypothetical protein